ncbi:MAG TPA: FAD-binding oxidoreductase [Candidatus Acidoferrales bacterium]|nr:FAD-binding oxidoreductase [Candidatus Acidoferrales bacterium]
MPRSSGAREPWGSPPWRIHPEFPQRSLPKYVDFAIVGGGFTGLAAAAWLRFLAPKKSVAVLEAGAIGAGASGRTGGIVLAETAAGELPGLGDVLAGMSRVLRDLERACGFSLVEGCELTLQGAWEIGRSGGTASSPIEWNDSGTLRVVNEVPGGTLNPGKQVNGLARAAARLGATIAERHRVQEIRWSDPVSLEFGRGRLQAGKVMFATNALSLELSGLRGAAHPKLTLAARTAPMTRKELEKIGLAAGKPFYTVDFPYLWGRICSDNSIIWGAGLADAPPSGDLGKVAVSRGRAAGMFASLENRVHALHPALANARFTHRWGGPIAFRSDFLPVFASHPRSSNGLVLGVFAGHGVALSVYLGAWAAEALLGRRNMPEWGRVVAK